MFSKTPIRISRSLAASHTFLSDTFLNIFQCIFCSKLCSLPSLRDLLVLLFCLQQSIFGCLLKLKLYVYYIRITMIIQVALMVLAPTPQSRLFIHLLCPSFSEFFTRRPPTTRKIIMCCVYSPAKGVVAPHRKSNERLDLNNENKRGISSNTTSSY